MFISMHVITSTIHIRLSKSLCSESLPPLLASFLSLFERRPPLPLRLFPHDLTADFAPLSMGLLHDEAGSKHIIRFLDAKFIELLLCERECLSTGLQEHFLQHELPLLIHLRHGFYVKACRLSTLPYTSHATCKGKTESRQAGCESCVVGHFVSVVIVLNRQCIPSTSVKNQLYETPCSNPSSRSERSNYSISLYECCWREE